MATRGQFNQPGITVRLALEVKIEMYFSDNHNVHYRFHDSTESEQTFTKVLLQQPE